MIAILAVLVALLGSTDAPATPDKKAILAKAAVCRGALKNSYNIVISRALALGDGGSEGANVSVWSKGPLMRTDEVKSSSTFDPEGVGRRTVVCRNCERAGFALVTKTGGRGSIALVQFARLDAAFDKNDQWRIDWRGLGMLDGGLARYATDPVNSSVIQFGAANERVEIDTHDGVECYVLTIPMRGKITGWAKCWFDSTRGMNPVKYDLNADGGAFRQSTVISLQKLDGLDVWYPSRIRHARFQGDKTLLDETLVVEAVRFGEQVSDETFKFAGMSLDEQQPVALPEVKQQKDYPVWRNGKLDGSYTAGQQAQEAYEFRLKQLDSAPPVPDRPPGVGRVWYYSGALLLGVAGLLAVYFARRRRSDK